MQLHSTQNIVASDTHRFRVLSCGRRWGKTTEAAEEIKGMALAASDSDKIAYIAPTYGQARDIAWEPFKKELGPIIISTNESRLELRVRSKNGGEVLILLRGWEAIETLRGQAFLFLVLDEVAMMRNFFVKWEEVLRPALADKQGQAMFISSPKGYNHFFTLFNLQEEKENPESWQDWKSFHFTTYDNPHIPVPEIEAMKATMTLDRFSQEVMAEFKKMEGLVYPEFNRDDCVFGDDKLRSITAKIYEWYAGVDFGFTNPTAMLKIGRDHDGNFYLIDEWVKTQKTNAEVIEYAKTMSITAFYPDPAEPDRIEEMRRNGLNCREVNKDINTGIDAVKNLLKNKKLFIYKNCVNTIAEIESYAWEESKHDRNDPEKPIDLNNHCMDALRYVLFMLSSSSQQRTVAVHYPQNNRPMPPVPHPTKLSEQGTGRVSIRYPSRRK